MYYFIICANFPSRNYKATECNYRKISDGGQWGKDMALIWEGRGWTGLVWGNFVLLWEKKLTHTPTPVFRLPSLTFPKIRCYAYLTG
ncbi:hypothetical protein Avbf_02345 [Armadillidium vulgare]|nr:hypothetical protein Avbf_02345 [Armadillidium vulgare]